MRLHPTGQFDNHALAHEYIRTQPLAAAMGAAVCDVQAARATDEQFAEVRQALFRHKMIYFRNQTLTHGDFESFGQRFGDFAEDAYTQGVPRRWVAIRCGPTRLWRT